ncbi:glutamate-5-semialdehyde dehydrogenase [Sneathiella glossodoripedis]|uniref:glutamate-5-semialdehyde dehydrogenase n=1 Tax=Sneathiella glossodoripedis TaxID=418853 RepID=UPI0004715F80|nr:glutamate-5-semialdehyde dehydrogenase [Sneathiella glossodoripedis]
MDPAKLEQIKTAMNKMGVAAQKASQQLAIAPNNQKNKALTTAADLLVERTQNLLEANSEDVRQIEKTVADAKKTLSDYTGNAERLLSEPKAIDALQNAVRNINRYNPAFIDRLTLTKDSIKNMAQGLRDIAKLDDPVGRNLAELKPRSDKLQIHRVSVPLGVIGIIYESRPNVTADAGALCLKSGNACILRGGSDSHRSSMAIIDCLKAGLEAAKLDPNCIQLVEETDRAAVNHLLTMSDTVDVIVPRGGKSLVKVIQEKSKIPVFSHLEGINHIFVDKEFDEEKAIKVIVNSKLRRTGVCGALETLLIHKNVAESFGAKITKILLDENCEVRGDETIQAFDRRVVKATKGDWNTEYLAPIISIGVVDDLQAAITHIQSHGSGHTDGIISENRENITEFQRRVDSAIVVVNASTQFADGGEFGMGAEIGISTGRMHARGPVGVEQLTTFKYYVMGVGTIRG